MNDMLFLLIVVGVVLAAFGIALVIDAITFLYYAIVDWLSKDDD